MHRFLSAREADLALSRLLAETPWKQGEITLFGRKHREPRLTAWYGDAPYTYSGRTVNPAPWTKTLRELKGRVEEASRARFNSVLINRYRDGRDGMGLHADDEAELGRNPLIASLSLGRTRRFVLKLKPHARNLTTSEARPLSLELAHGELLVMAGSCQHHYVHGVPKVLSLEGERLNLTFRLVAPR